MEKMSLKNELSGNSYPGRGIIIGKSADGKHAITAYFIMGRSENSRRQRIGNAPRLYCYPHRHPFRQR